MGEDSTRSIAEISATREVLAREGLDALVEALIRKGVLDREDAAVMSERLARRLLHLADGTDDTEFLQLRLPMLREEAARLHAQAMQHRLLAGASKERE